MLQIIDASSNLGGMSDEKIHPNVAKVTDAARKAGFEIQVKKFPEGTKTAQDAATAIGVSVGQRRLSLDWQVQPEGRLCPK